MWFIFHFQLFVWFSHLLSLPTKIFQNILFAIHIAYDTKIWFFFFSKNYKLFFLFASFAKGMWVPFINPQMWVDM
jgi:hypothetical protein